MQPMIVPPHAHRVLKIKLSLCQGPKVVLKRERNHRIIDYQLASITSKPTFKSPLYATMNFLNDIATRIHNLTFQYLLASIAVGNHSYINQIKPNIFKGICLCKEVSLVNEFEG